MYANQAEAEDELSFHKDDILQVLRKDHNGQLDWWLCQIPGGSVGMVPANYLEVFHARTTSPPFAAGSGEDYDVPKQKRKAPVANAVRQQPPQKQTGIPLDEFQSKYADYDYPRSTPVQADEDPCEDRDYDLPPPDIPITESHDIYDRPPSTKSSRSGFSNRISTASAGSSQLYDIPPGSPSAIYDFPPPELTQKPSSPQGRKSSDDGRSSRQSSGPGIDVSSMYENEAEEMLTNLKRDMDQEYDNLWQCVYGSNAYWGSENKSRRNETLQRTLAAAKQFDRSLVSLVEFGKGVSHALEISKDANFKRKCAATNTILANKRQEIIVKIDILVEADEKEVPITTTVKLLLEVSRTIPQAVQAFMILVQANKAILFKSASPKAEDVLPVLTKSEVRNRPLPELPEPKSVKQDGDDYADIAGTTDEDFTTAKSLQDEPPQQVPAEWTDAYGRRRNPQDELPPLPFATLHKQSKKKKAQGNGTPTNAPPANRLVADNHRDVDYDDIDGPAPPGRMSVGTPTMLHPRNNVMRQSSGSIHSNSSDGTSSPRRSNSPSLYNGAPYGASTNGYIERSGSPLPLRQEDRELLSRYCQQMDLLVPSLREAIEAFVLSIKANETPKGFVTKSKMAVVAAYKLVYIADALYQKILHNGTKVAIVVASNNLTETIKVLVSETKSAALQYPSVKAMEKMFEGLRRLYPCAIDLVNTVKTPPTLV